MSKQLTLNNLHKALVDMRERNMWGVVYFEVNGDAYYVMPHAYGLSVHDECKQIFVIRFKHFRDYQDNITAILDSMLNACYDKLTAKFGARFSYHVTRSV